MLPILISSLLILTLLPEIQGQVVCAGLVCSGGRVDLVTTTHSTTPVYIVPAGVKSHTTYYEVFTSSSTSSTFDTTMGTFTTNQLVTFDLCMDGAGGWSAVLPPTVLNARKPDRRPSACTSKTYRFDGTNLKPIDAITGLGGQGQGLSCTEGTTPLLNPDSGDIDFYCNSATHSFHTLTPAGVDTDQAAVVLQSTPLTLTAAQVNALAGTAQTIVAAPGSGKYIKVISATLSYVKSTAFTDGATGHTVFSYNGIGGLSVMFTGSAFETMITGATTKVLEIHNVDQAAFTTASVADLQLTFYNYGGNFTVGTGSTVKITVQYVIETL